MNDLKWAIVDEIETLGYTPEIFTNPKGKPGLASSRAWGARDAEEVARRCMGAAIIGMARWTFQDDDGRSIRLPTEFYHYEGALTRTFGLRPWSLFNRTSSGALSLIQRLEDLLARYPRQPVPNG